MDASKDSTAFPNSKKSTHLMPGNTDNADGMVGILCCAEQWLRRIQNPKTIGGYGIRKKWYTRRESNPKPSDP